MYKVNTRYYENVDDFIVKINCTDGVLIYYKNGMKRLSKNYNNSDNISIPFSKYIMKQLFKFIDSDLSKPEIPFNINEQISLIELTIFINIRSSGGFVRELLELEIKDFWKNYFIKKYLSNNILRKYLEKEIFGEKQILHSLQKIKKLLEYKDEEKFEEVD